MPPRKRKQHAGAINYLKRKDTVGRGGASGSVARVEGGSGSVEEWVEGGSESVAGVEVVVARVEGQSGSVDAEIGEGRDGYRLETLCYSIVAKRPRLLEIGAMADEPVQAWLDNLPHDDTQHMVLVLYARLPTIFSLQKTDTAAAVGTILSKN